MHMQLTDGSGVMSVLIFKTKLSTHSAFLNLPVESGETCFWKLIPLRNRDIALLASVSRTSFPKVILKVPVINVLHTLKYSATDVCLHTISKTFIQSGVLALKVSNFRLLISL